MEHPIATVLEEGRIQSVGDFVRLNIVDWNRATNPHLMMDSLSSYLINRASYVILEVDLYQYPKRNDFPEWKHAGSEHTLLGELFWNFFHYVYDGDLHFHDMPDFSGTIRHKDRKPQAWEVWGDIGKVSPIAMRDMAQTLRYYSLWMSAVDWNRLIIVEPLVPVTNLIPETFVWKSLACERYGEVIPKHD